MAGININLPYMHSTLYLRKNYDLIPLEAGIIDHTIPVTCLL